MTLWPWLLCYQRMCINTTIQCSPLFQSILTCRLGSFSVGTCWPPPPQSTHRLASGNWTPSPAELLCQDTYKMCKMYRLCSICSPHQNKEVCTVTGWSVHVPLVITNRLRSLWCSRSLKNRLHSNRLHGLCSPGSFMKKTGCTVTGCAVYAPPGHLWKKNRLGSNRLCSLCSPRSL